MNFKEPVVIINVSGGVIQEVLTNTAIPVVLIDFDDNDSQELSEAYIKLTDENPELISVPLIPLPIEPKIIPQRFWVMCDVCGKADSLDDPPGSGWLSHAWFGNLDLGPICPTCAESVTMDSDDFDLPITKFNPVTMPLLAGKIMERFTQGSGL